MSDLDELQRKVGEWGQETFPNADHNTIMAHLEEEITELHNAVMLGGLLGHSIAEEAADCLLLLMHLGYRLGFSLYDSAVVKMAINEKRTWNTVTPQGYTKHDEVPL